MYIVGASTLGEIVLGIMNRMGGEVTGFYDDVYEGKYFCEKPVLGPIRDLALNPDVLQKGAVVAIGDNGNRRKISEDIRAMQVPLVNVVDARATLELTSRIGSGNLIMAGAYIGVKTIIGDGNLIFPGVSITHHNTVGNYNFFSPNSSVGGYTEISDECKFSMNCVVAPYIRIESGVSTQPGSYLSGHKSI